MQGGSGCADATHLRKLRMGTCEQTQFARTRGFGWERSSGRATFRSSAARPKSEPARRDGPGSVAIETRPNCATVPSQAWAKATPAIYVRLAKGAGGLAADSIVLLDQTRSLDAARVRRFLGAIDKKTLDAIVATWIGIFRR